MKQCSSMTILQNETGHSLISLNTVKRNSPNANIFHDLYSECPAVLALGRNGYFCSAALEGLSLIPSKWLCLCLSPVFSNWQPVTSGVSQGSGLGPTLYNVLTSNLDDGIKCTPMKIADDTKQSGQVGTSGKSQPARKLEYTEKWADKNLIKLKVKMILFAWKLPQGKLAGLHIAVGPSMCCVY